MSSDGMIIFEESNWTDLAEKFIKKNRDKWEDFVMKEYEDACMAHEITQEDRDDHCLGDHD